MFESTASYLARVNAKGLMNYKPSSSFKYDAYRITEKDNDRSNDTNVRLAIELQNK